MPIEFQITQRPVGFAGSSVSEGESVMVNYRELVSPTDVVRFLTMVENLQGTLFNSIPGLPSPSVTDHLLVVIRPDLSGVAYVNELNMMAMIKANRSIQAGEAVLVSDVEDIASIDLGVEIPEDAAVVFIRSIGWRRSLFFDFGPLLANPVPRDYSLKSALAKQALLLLGLSTPDEEGESAAGETRLVQMKAGLSRLQGMLTDNCEDESEYQKLLEEHPWMLGGHYDRVQRHTQLDDRRIPDFTARRSYDLSHDIIEIKQPFLRLFRRNGDLAAPFNDAWNQAGDYLAFTIRQRAYLRDEKDLLFENPRCLLLIGYELSDEQRKRIRDKESLTGSSITVMTYNELLRTATHLVNLTETASERIAEIG